MYGTKFTSPMSQSEGKHLKNHTHHKIYESKFRKVFSKV